MGAGARGVRLTLRGRARGPDWHGHRQRDPSETALACSVQRGKVRAYIQRPRPAAEAALGRPRTPVYGPDGTVDANRAIARVCVVDRISCTSLATVYPSASASMVARRPAPVSR